MGCTPFSVLVADRVFLLVKKLNLAVKPVSKTLRSREFVKVSSLNVYPAKGNELKVLGLIAKEVDLAVNEHLSGRGEVIRLRVNGEIIDSGVKSFLVEGGFVYEVYCFKCFANAFIRVILEKSLQTGERWISVDVDEVVGSPWFKEE